MTYSTQTPAAAFTGSTSTGPYNLNARVDDPTHLFVTKNDVALVNGVDYTINTTPAAGAIKFPTGLDITLTVAPAASDDILLYRETPAEQGQVYTDFGDFPAESHELQLDRAAMRDDEQNAKLGGLIPVTGSFVTQFNGRSGDVTPQSGDYNADQITDTAGRVLMTGAERTKLAALPGSTNLDDLGDVNAGSPTEGDLLQYSSGLWVPYALTQVQNPLVAEYRAYLDTSAAPSTNGNCVPMDTVVENDFTLGQPGETIGEIESDQATFGWGLKALVDIRVHLSGTYRRVSGSTTVGFSVGIQGVSGADWTDTISNAGADNIVNLLSTGLGTVSADFILKAGETVRFHTDFGSAHLGNSDGTACRISLIAEEIV